jgi:hypothetical protein
MVPKLDTARFMHAWRENYESAFPGKKSRAKWALSGAAGAARRVR